MATGGRSRFTPGPWQVAARRTERDGHVVVSDRLVEGADGQVVAWCGVTPRASEVRPPDEITANAVLVAAAPELLDTLARLARKSRTCEDHEVQEFITVEVEPLLRAFGEEIPPDEPM